MRGRTTAVTTFCFRGAGNGGSDRRHRRFLKICCADGIDLLACPSRPESVVEALPTIPADHHAARKISRAPGQADEAETVSESEPWSTTDDQRGIRVRGQRVLFFATAPAVVTCNSICRCHPVMPRPKLLVNKAFLEETRPLRKENDNDYVSRDLHCARRISVSRIYARHSGDYATLPPQHEQRFQKN